MGRFQGKVIVVTGAASGMGLSIARRFATEGAHVALGDVDDANGELAAKSIRETGGSAFFHRVDVTSMDDTSNFVAEAVRRFDRLDYSANMAGIALSGGLFASSKDRDLCVAVNLTGTFNCVASQARAMKRTGGGVIINCSSVGGLRGSAYSPYYNAAKHGVIGFTKSVAIEMAEHRIRVNVICPGLTRSAMTDKYYSGNVDALTLHVPLGRIGEPDDQASAVAWLCSDEASFITGTVLSVDGGQMAGSPLSLKPADG